MLTARIQKLSPRYDVWQRAFGTDEIAIVEPPKENAGGQMRMLVDVTRLTGAQRRTFASILSQTLLLPADRVLAELLASGSYPISAEDVDVVQKEEAGRLF